MGRSKGVKTQSAFHKIRLRHCNAATGGSTVSFWFDPEEYAQSVARAERHRHLDQPSPFSRILQLQLMPTMDKEKGTDKNITLTNGIDE